MKTIGLMLTRNEGHILPTTLPPLAQVCDHIIIADQNSTDDTRAVIKKCTKAILIDNPPSPTDGNYETQGRNLLLDAARNFDGNNLLLMIDADEIAPPAVFCHLKEDIHDHYPVGMKFVTPWLLIWKKTSRYFLPYVSPEGLLQPRLVAWILYDNRQCQYQDSKWVHSGRLPTPPSKNITLPPRYSLLHFHWIFLERARWQQAWYLMHELKNAQFNLGRVDDINRMYQPYNTLFDRQITFTRRLPKEWRTGYKPPPHNSDDPKFNWRKSDVWKLIDQYGIKAFEPLDIWFVPELKEHFEQEMKRPPQWQRLPKINLPLSQLSHATQWEARREKLREAIQWEARWEKLWEAIQWETRRKKLREAIKKPERRIRQTTWYKKLKGKKA